MATHCPVLVNHALASDASLAATASAVRAHAGDWVQASAAALPAEVTTSTPSAVSASTALSTATLTDPPRLMTTIDVAPPPPDCCICCCCCATHAMPASTLALLPVPEQSNTRTGCSVTQRATPKLEPATVADTCVPWPLQSAALPPGVMASNPWASVTSLPSEALNWEWFA